jgi:hypothetical protein
MFRIDKRYASTAWTLPVPILLLLWVQFGEPMPDPARLELAAWLLLLAGGLVGLASACLDPRFCASIERLGRQFVQEVAADWSRDH